MPASNVPKSPRKRLLRRLLGEGLKRNELITDRFLQVNVHCKSHTFPAVLPILNKKLSSPLPFVCWWKQGNWVIHQTSQKWQIQWISLAPSLESRKKYYKPFNNFYWNIYSTSITRLTALTHSFLLWQQLSSFGLSTANRCKTGRYLWPSSVLYSLGDNYLQYWENASDSRTSEQVRWKVNKWVNK